MGKITMGAVDLDRIETQPPGPLGGHGEIRQHLVDAGLVERYGRYFARTHGDGRGAERLAPSWLIMTSSSKLARCDLMGEESHLAFIDMTINAGDRNANIEHD